MMVQQEAFRNVTQAGLPLAAFRFNDVSFFYAESYDVFLDELHGWILVQVSL